MPRYKLPRRRFKIARLVILAVVTVLLVAGLVGLYFVQVRRQSGQLLVRAEAHNKKQEWAAAAQLYKSYVKIRRDQPEVLLAYAKTLEELRKTKPEFTLDAQKTYEQILVLEPDRTEERKKLVKVYFQLQQGSAAEVNLKTLSSAKNAAEDVELQLLWADWHQIFSKNPSAIADSLRKAIATGKAEPGVYGRLARVLKVDIKPTTPENEKEAEEVIAQLLKEKPNDVKARLVRADYRFYFHGPDASREEVLYAYRNIPEGATSPNVALALQRLAVSPEDVTVAKEALTKALASNPENASLKLAMADILSRTSDPASAKKTLQDAIQNAPVDIILVEVSEKLLAMGDTKSAYTQAERLAAERRMAPFATYLRGRAALAEGRWNEAIDPLKRSLPGLKNYPAQWLQTHLALADCYRRAGLLDLCREELLSALKLDPKSAQVKFLLGNCHAELGQIPAAMEMYLAALPNLPEARVPLARLRLAQQVAKPENERNWLDVETILGPEPHHGELSVIKANMLFLRGQDESAIKTLEAACLRPDTGPAPRVALVVAVAARDRAAAAKLLDRFEVELKNGPEIRLARARFLLEEKKPDLAALQALTTKLEGLSPAQRSQLFDGLGDLYVQAGSLKDAVPLFRQALANSPSDIALHLKLFDLGLSLNDGLLRREMLDGLTKLEGNNGPAKIIAEVTEAVSQSNSDAIRVPEWRRRVQIAREARPSWPRPFVLLGDLDRLARQTDSALQNYREANRLGDQSDNLLRIMTPLLIERQSQQELMEILAKRNRLAPLPADLAQQLALLRSIYAEDSEKSLAWARSSQALASKDFRDHLRRASIFRAGKSYPEARTAIELALSLNNSAPEAWVAMVQFLVQTDRLEDAMIARKAAETSMKATSATPAERAAVERARAVCRELTKDLAGAEEAYKSAVSLDPTDLSSHEAYLQFLARVNRRAEIPAQLTKLIQSAETPVIRRWARRSMAIFMLTGPEAYAERGAALQLVETNLVEGGNLLEDVRLKSLIIGLDPFQQTEAINMLRESAKSVPLSAEQSYLLARLYLATGNLQAADETLRYSTRAVFAVAPEHLAQLCQIQLKRGLKVDARQTVERLKLVAPKSWPAISEECRVLAAEGKLAQAGKILLEEYGQQPRAVLAARIAPFLEQIGSQEAANSLFQKLAEEKVADSHIPYAGYLIRQNQIDLAWKLLNSRLTDSTPGPTARLLAAAARMKPVMLLTGTNQDAWRAEIQQAETWLQSQRQANPDSVDLIIAAADFADAQGRHDEAIQGYRTALEKNADHPAALNNLALLLALHTRDRTANSLQLINRLIAKRGPQATYLDTRGLVHLVGERYDEAAKDLETALRLEPKPLYQFHLAWVYDKQSAEQSVLSDRRDNLLKLARSAGLTKQQLHPREWEEFDRLYMALK